MELKSALCIQLSVFRFASSFIQYVPVNRRSEQVLYLAGTKRTVIEFVEDSAKFKRLDILILLFTTMCIEQLSTQYVVLTKSELVLTKLTKPI